MAKPTSIYKFSLSLLTDLYQLTMAYGYWKLDRADDEAVFNLFFRKHPFGGGYTVAAGLAYVVDFIENLSFAQDDIDYLATLCGNDGKPLFNNGFLKYLGEMKFWLDVDAVEEGTVVFPQQPLIRVKGPLLQCQLIETTLLNMVNFQTLIATKASRICHSTKGEPVLEFGLRRAQGIDGALAASRAAYIGGGSATSNVLAGKLFGIPVKGTHAHSWVMSFDDEQESFSAYSQAMPNNCVFLVDTYDTIEGVKKAISIGKQLREQGHEMVGIRLDSGDLAYLSIEARKLLDTAGFDNAVIVASNDLDEHIIKDLKDQGAKIAVWGVGTKLATAYDQPALGGVYKLAAIRRPEQDWQYKVKLSEQAIKVSIPGIQQVRRYYNNDGFVADAIYDEQIGISEPTLIVDNKDNTRHKTIESNTQFEDLLRPIFRSGKCVYKPLEANEARERCLNQMACLHTGIKRFVNPHEYPAGLEKQLHALKIDLIEKARKA